MNVTDSHVHSEFSEDAPYGSMERTCQRAVEIGLPALAFTDHADFLPVKHAAGITEMLGAEPPDGVRVLPESWPSGLDVNAYWKELERCRDLFPALTILSGVELGEAHLFPKEAAALLAKRPYDRVLGSMHVIIEEGIPTDTFSPHVMQPERAEQSMRSYLRGVADLVNQNSCFDVLTHLDYAKRHWPHHTMLFDELHFEDEYRAVLAAAVRAGITIEINTTGGSDPVRGLCPGFRTIQWWYEMGGKAVSFASDAHKPELLAKGFDIARQAAEQAGFRPGKKITDFWRR